jgi:hypothetical protein
MKTLKESLLDDIDSTLKQGSTGIKDAVKDFLKLNYNYASKLKISRKVNDNGLYEVSAPIGMKLTIKNRNLTEITNGLFEFVELYGAEFLMCEQLKSLKGLPKHLKGNLLIYGCGLTSLEGCPESINGQFICQCCHYLTSLEYGPKTITKDYACDNCANLTSLKGCPDTVLDFSCRGCHGLTSLEGCPKQVLGKFDCSACRGLITLKGSPSYVKDNFRCDGCSSLKSLEGCTKEIGESFICDECGKLKTLEHGPIKVGNVYSVRECKNLISLKGLENTIIPGIFNCSNCYALESLEGCPKQVTGSFVCYGCKRKFEPDEILSVCDTKLTRIRVENITL